MAKIESARESKNGNDAHFGDAAGRSDGGAAEAGQIVAIGAGDPLDQAKLTHAVELSGEGGGGQGRDQGSQVSPAQSTDIELRALQGAKQRLFASLEEVQSLDEAIAIVALILAEPIKGTSTGAVVVESGQILQISSAAAEHDLAEIDQAVDRLLEGRQLATARTLTMFHLAVVLEKGDVVNRRLDAQHE